jgi:hypothetical protein
VDGKQISLILAVLIAHSLLTRDTGADTPGYNSKPITGPEPKEVAPMFSDGDILRGAL